MADDSFPRGGVSVRNKEENKGKKHKITKDKDLFQVTADEKQPVKKKRKRHQQKEDEKKKDSADGIFKPNLGHISLLTPKNMAVDMILLGFVKDIHDYELVISLPNGQLGVVGITNISTTYTKCLQKMVDSGGLAPDLQVCSLKEIFKVGQLVQTKIVKVPENKKDKACLTLNPEEINSNFTAEKLQTGMILCGSVSSCEDHGYIVNVGIKGVNAFLKLSEAEKIIREENEGGVFRIGQHLTVMVKHITKTGEKRARTVQLSVNPTEISKKVVEDEDDSMTLDLLMPGMKVKSSVVKVNDDGIIIELLKFTGSIHMSHLLHHPQRYTAGQKFTTKVLYIHPLTKVIALTQLAHLVSPDPSSPITLAPLEVGQVIKNARITRVEPRRAVYMDIGSEKRCIAYWNQLSDKPVSSEGEEFTLGKVFRCRVRDLNFMENIVVVTLKKSILDQKFIRYSDVQVGSVVEGKITRFLDKGLIVEIALGICGFVPMMHMADVTISNPKKKFSEGQLVKCKVLELHAQASRILLTMKQTLVTSPLPSITSYDQCEPQSLAHGFIGNILPNSVLVIFCNHVKGWITKQELSHTLVNDPKNMFYKGQVVKARIIRCDPEKKKLFLSLKTKENKSKKEIVSNIVVGEISKCIVKSKTDSGLGIVLEPSKIEAFLPTCHLSDYSANCKSLLKSFSVNDKMTKVICVSNQGTVTMSRKNSFLQAATADTFIKSFNELKIGMHLPGFVKKVMEYGIFVDLLHGLVGLVPNKFLTDGRISSADKVFTEGDSIVAKVTEIDTAKGRFLASLRMSDCYHKETSSSLDHLEEYVNEYQKICSSLSRQSESHCHIDHFSPGKIIKATISKVFEETVECEVEFGIKAEAPIEHTEGIKCKVGSCIEAVVLHVDPIRPTVIISFNKKIVTSRKNFQDTKYTKVKISEVLKAEVLLVKEEFVLALLQGHATGKIVYIPVKKHPNDRERRHMFTVGQTHSVTIKRIDKEKTLATLHIDEQTGGKEKVDLSIGQIYPAEVKNVLELQLNINIGGWTGRVHITELTDDVCQKLSPVKNFCAGQQIKVKVIGSRQVNRNKSSVSKAQKGVIYECSTKNSRLSTTDIPTAPKYKEGDIVRGFVRKFDDDCMWMCVSPQWEGHVLNVNTSHHTEIKTQPSLQFIPGTSHMATILRVQGHGQLELSLIGKPDEVVEDTIVDGVISSIFPNYGLNIQLAGGAFGHVALTDIADVYEDTPTDKFVLGEHVKCFALGKEKFNTSRWILSLRPTRLGETKKKKKEKQRPETVDHSSLILGQLLEGYVHHCDSAGVHVTLSRETRGLVPVKYCSSRRIRDLDVVFYPGRLVTAAFIEARQRKSPIILSLLEEDNGVKEVIPDEFICDKGEKSLLELEEQRKRKHSDKPEGSKAKRAKSGEESDSGFDDVQALDSESEYEDEEKAPVCGQPSLTLTVNEGFSWDEEFKLPTPVVKKSDIDATKKRKTKAELREEQKLEEIKLYKHERQILEGEQVPEVAADFDRLALQSPNSSLVWLRYMAFHLETSEVEKARSVADRALKTISFREEQEKMNIWVAYLNLENMYGTTESLQEVLTRALQYNDQITLYQQLINIYIKSGKMQSAEQLYQVMTRKFSQNREIWLGYGMFCFRNEKSEVGRQLLQRSLKSLPIKDHIEIISKFAQLEFKHGEPERGRTLFEKLLSTYPKRTDIWSVYIDMMIKIQDTTSVRKLLERAIHLTLSVKKMKFFFKKYMDFEEKYGTEETLDRVKKKAVEYVESKVTETE